MTAQATKLKILFLCTGNSCRSQMAEGWARHLKGDRIEPYSAGIIAHGLDPRAVRVMAEQRVDISWQRSKHVDEVRDIDFDMVVTVCDHAREHCPVFPGKTRMVHVGFEDPPTLARQAATEEEALTHYRRVRDEIRDLVETLPDALNGAGTPDASAAGPARRINGESPAGAARDRELYRNRKVRQVTLVGLVVNVCLAALKLAGGVIGRSQAVVADAVHSISDMTTDLAILLGVQYWSRPADRTHPHGHRRIETVVTLSIGVALAIVASALLYNALVTMHERHEGAPRWIAFAAAFVSIICKEVLYRWTVAAGRRVKSTSLRANAWHHRSDALSSIPAALAVAGAAIDPSWSFLDHVGAVVVSLFIYQAAFRVIRPAFDTLIDSGAPQEKIERIAGIAEGTEGVRRAHGIRTRYVGSEALAVDLHIEVDSNISVREGHDISEAVSERLLSMGPDVIDVVVHLEPHTERAADAGGPDRNGPGAQST